MFVQVNGQIRNCTGVRILPATRHDRRQPLCSRQERKFWLPCLPRVSADPLSRRRRTLHPDQRALPIPDLAQQPAIYAYSFILTNLDVFSPDKAIAAEHWYRHRTTVENIFRDSKLGAALGIFPPDIPR